MLEQEIIDVFKNYIEKGNGDLKANEIEKYRKFPTNSKEYAYYKFINHCYNYPKIELEHGVLLRQAVRWSSNRIRNIFKLNSELKKFAQDCDVQYINNSLRVEEYRPDWLNLKKEQKALDSPPEKRQSNEEVDADHWLKNFLVIKHGNLVLKEKHVSKLINSPPGSLNIVCLPTGSGKSLLFHTASTISSGLTIVIVPTVSLAIDHYQSSKKILDKEFSTVNPLYFSGDQVDQNQNIIQSIKNNSCRLLITSRSLVFLVGFLECSRI